jgi:hypothetical protein
MDLDGVRRVAHHRQPDVHDASNGIFRQRRLSHRWLFETLSARNAPNWDRGAPAPWSGRLAAAISLTVWIMIVFFGRRIGSP